VTAADLLQLDDLLSRAHAVVAMQEIHAGNSRNDVIGLRHDVDDNADSLATAVKLARWEAERGYRSTFFMLHTASYWQASAFEDSLYAIARHGHEIGIHANALAHALRNGGDPDEILWDAIEDLRTLGFPVRGVAGHGDGICFPAGIINDEQFLECARPEMGAPDRAIKFNGITLTLAPKPLEHFGLVYESLRLPRARYQSDSGGRWYEPMTKTVAEFPSERGQLHLLVHPDWYGEAL
jgi:hypothetical protein